MILSRLLARLVDRCQRHARLVFLVGLVLGVVAASLAVLHLGVITDTDKMFADSLPWRQRALALQRDFPQFHELIVVVIDAREPEEADATANALATAIAADQAHFRSVRRPDASPFLTQEGLLFLGIKPLEALLNRIIDAQPFLGQLAADPSARGLFASLSLIGLGVQKGQVELGPYLPTLRALHDVMRDTLDGHPRPLSWARLLGGDLSELAGKYRFVLVQPKLDYGALQPGGAATRAIRAAAADLQFVKSGDARVRLTGAVPLADEEFSTVTQDAAYGLLGSLVLITVWLLLAVGSWRLIVPMLLTLTLGLALTLLFAAVAIGTLNLISVGFGILFVGIAVDFAIQFSVRYRSFMAETADASRALVETGRRVGVQILVAAAATAAGFLAFVPTEFQGVAELGLIAGVGMLIAFACSLSFLPAAIAVFRPPGEDKEVGFRWAATLDPLLRRGRASVLGAFAALAVLGLALLPKLTFDADPLHVKNPDTEAMRTLSDLMESPVTNPLTIDVITPDFAAAKQLTERLRQLPLVASTLSIASYIPDEQPAKLALIADANSILSATLGVRAAAAPVTPDQVRLAAKTALDQITPALEKLAADHPLAAIAEDLRRIASASDQVVMALNAALTRFLPTQLDRLRSALGAKPITLASIPPEIARDWLLPDGRARVQAVPTREVASSSGLAAFVEQVRAVAPDAGGAAVTLEATSGTVVGAFRTAAIGALIAITAILFAALRRPLDVALVLAPLLLSALLTVLVMAAAKLPLNYANVIALPLLLGVGVSFNIYFVMNWRAGQRSVLGSATARAILFSALTTGTAFGSLALSAHAGTASMGVLLLISLGCTLVASLVFIPALLAAVPGPRNS